MDVERERGARRLSIPVILGAAACTGVCAGFLFVQLISGQEDPWYVLVMLGLAVLVLAGAAVVVWLLSKTFGMSASSMSIPLLPFSSTGCLLAPVRLLFFARDWDEQMSPQKTSKRMWNHLLAEGISPVRPDAETTADADRTTAADTPMDA